MNSCYSDSVVELETQYHKRFGHTYTVLKARAVPKYYVLLSSAVQLGTELTDAELGIKFTEGADQ